MNRRKLLAALAGWLVIPTLALAQSEGPRLTSDLSTPYGGATSPAQLPQSAAQPPKALSVNANVKTLPPGAEIVLPKKAESQPAVTIEELPYDPRPYNQRWLRRYGIVEDEMVDPAPRFAVDPGVNQLVWIVPEWIVWKTSGMHVPPLVTGSAPGAAQSDSGVIGTGDTRVLFGNETQLQAFRSGIRVRGGFWIDPAQTLGIEGGMFFLGQKSKGAVFSNSGDPLSLARPYFDTATGLRSSEVVAFSTVNADGSLTPAVSGSIIARTTSDFWGADINFRRYLVSNDIMRVDGLLGFRYQRLRDTLETHSNSTINTTGAIGDLSSGTVLQVQDLFHTTSNFYGGQLGLASEWRRDRWFIGMTGKLALGVVQQEVRINGLTSITTPGATTPVVTVGGLLAQNSNIGRHRSDRFSVIPELGMNVGYQLTSNIRVFAGYSFLYWSNVVRAGDQIDLTVNSSQLQRTTSTTATLSGEARPGFGAAFRESGFWAHGGNLGLEFRW